MWTSPFGTSLADRVLALDAEAVALRGELARHDLARRDLARRDLAPQHRPLAPAARLGTARHSWPLADPTRDPATLEPYDRRPDDPVLLAARRGADFLDALAGADPHRLRQAAGALAALQRPDSGIAPDISVIVPVHGQLVWTLNCLHALLGHASRRRFEVLIVDDASPDDTASVLGELAQNCAGLRVLTQPRNDGFIAACNAGAAAAQGDLLVLLNNDTRVVDGWLDALADSFALFPRAGLVGSKLLYPDGSLQEAGGILWRDGSAWNYGRDQDPNHPAFCHARQVDYVSGAAIALPAALWRRLGGLDPLFAPAYGEDADLALRVRAAGHEVWLQPASRVIHYEGRTGGLDTGNGTKAFQLVNLRKLFVRWHHTLETHGRPGSEPYLERDRTALRRALVVDATTPTPREDAGSVVLTESIRLLQNLGYRTHFAPQDNFLFQPEHTGALQRGGVECAYAPYDLGFDDFIARHGALFDVVMVFRPAVFAAVRAALQQHAPQAAVVFSNADLHFLRLERQAALTGSTVPATVRTEELALIASAPVTMTLSHAERDLIEREAPDACVVLQPFPCKVVGTDIDFAERWDFLFLGGYGHPPNVDAARWFARDVLPGIAARLPGARAILAGANPTHDISALADARIEVTGGVEELRGLFDRARVFVCPVRAGAGVKGKIIAALAHGLPVVTTSIGAEGIDAECLVADSAEAFADACVRLHGDAVLWRRLSRAGLAFVAEACSPEAGERALAAAIDLAYARQLGLR